MEASKDRFTRPSKVVSAVEAARLIKDNDTVSTSGFFGAGFAESIAIALQARFEETQAPRGLTLFFPAGQADYGSRGLSRLGAEGLVGKVIAGHWGTAPSLCEQAMQNKIQGYNLPQGVITHMLRDIAAHKPRTITSVGLGTFVDPRNGGGKVNEITTEELVELIEFDGEEYLAYKTFPIDVAILRGTTADVDGNITMEKEALFLESLAMATAVRNSGGTVIVQVERIAQSGTLNPQQVKIPKVMVDYIVQAPPEHHRQTYGAQYNPAFSGEVRVPLDSIAPMDFTVRKVLARRAAFELEPSTVVNLGLGIPDGVASVANEEGILDQITLTAEPGIIGGMPAGDLDFGAAYNADAIIDQPSQFDFYHGGGLDVAFLGLAQADGEGNLNVSRFGPKLTGSGGFIDITQNAKRVVFMGTFTAGGLEVEVQDGQLKILKEGRVKKFLSKVEQVTFSGYYAQRKKQPVLFITERCVFSLTERGMELVEVAPGVDLERDILAHMEFKPVLADNIATMDNRIFCDEKMGLS